MENGIVILMFLAIRDSVSNTRYDKLRELAKFSGVIRDSNFLFEKCN